MPRAAFWVQYGKGGQSPQISASQLHWDGIAGALYGVILF